MLRHWEVHHQIRRDGVEKTRDRTAKTRAAVESLNKINTKSRCKRGKIHWKCNKMSTKDE